jgi:hypothetical protein
MLNQILRFTSIAVLMASGCAHHDASQSTGQVHGRGELEILSNPPGAKIEKWRLRWRYPMARKIQEAWKPAGYHRRDSESSWPISAGQSNIQLRIDAQADPWAASSTFHVPDDYERTNAFTVAQGVP